MSRRKRILMLCNGSAEQTTSLLFASLGNRIRERHDVCLRLRTLPRGVFSKMPMLIATEIANIRSAIRSDVILVHSSLSLSLITILFFRMLGRPIHAFIWDFYPESTRMTGTIRNGLLLWLYAQTERFCYSCASRIYVPSQDYADFPALKGWNKVRLMPLWPRGDRVLPGKKQILPDAKTIHVVFAGQMNAIRNISGALQQVAAQGVYRIHLHLYSKDETPEALGKTASLHDNLELTHHGFVTPDEIHRSIAEADFGLVALATDFSLPSFPSKFFDYISAGIPVLYYGPTGTGVSIALQQYRLGWDITAKPAFDFESINILRANFSQERDRFFSFCNGELNEFIEFL